MATLRRRRIRRVLKWGGLVLSLLIVVAWVVSLFWVWTVKYCSVDNNSCYRIYRFGSGAGGVFAYYDLMNPHRTVELPGLTLRHGPPTWLAWRPRWERCTSTGQSKTLSWWWMMLPLWMPFLLVAIPTAILFWHDRRIPPGHCQRCGYDLTGNVSGACPECGTAVPPLPSAPPGDRVH